LRPDSLLSKSILSLASTRDGSHSIVLTTLNIFSIDPAFISLSDYVVRGYPNPRSWVEYYRLHGLSFSQEPKVQASQIIITTDVVTLPNPDHLDTEEAHLEFDRGTPGSIVMNIEELNTIPYQEDIPMPTQPAGLQKEDVSLEIGPLDDIRMGSDSMQRSDSHDTQDETQFGLSEISIHDATERLVAYESHHVNDSNLAFSESSPVASNRTFLEPPHGQKSVTTGGNNDDRNLISLLVQLLSSQSKVT
jgi:hypothetical protein